MTGRIRPQPQVVKQEHKPENLRQKIWQKLSSLRCGRGPLHRRECQGSVACRGLLCARGCTQACHRWRQARSRWENAPWCCASVTNGHHTAAPMLAMVHRSGDDTWFHV